MPWKGLSVLNLRKEFVLRCFEGKLSLTELCKEYGISRKTGQKWKARFLERGLDGLLDRSRCPVGRPSQLDEEVVCRIVKLKLAHRSWGPRKIRDVFGRMHPEISLPSESTFKRVLAKSGLVERRRRKSRKETGRLSHRVLAERPNHVWTVDLKGWWRTRDRARFEPLTIRDQYSRFVLCASALPDTRSETVRAAFDEVFRRHGLPEVIRSDNGSPFAASGSPLGLSRLSAWWLALGIDLDRTAPARPDENGSHERTHRDIALEVEAFGGDNAREQQASLDTWRVTYNHDRPHEAIGMARPAELYENSPRVYDGSSIELEYPVDYLKRRVRRSGQIRLHGVDLTVSRALSGWTVGLELESEGRYGLWFSRLRLGVVDLSAQKFWSSCSGQSDLRVDG